MRRRLAVFLLACLAVPGASRSPRTRTRRSRSRRRPAQGRVDRPQADRTSPPAGRRSRHSRDRCGPQLPGLTTRTESDLILTGEADGGASRTRRAWLPSRRRSERLHDEGATRCSRGRAATKPALARCLAQLLQAKARPTRAAQGHDRQAPAQIAFPKLAPRTAAYRVVARRHGHRETARRTTVPFTLHVVVLGNGPRRCRADRHRPREPASPIGRSARVREAAREAPGRRQALTRRRAGC